MVGQKKGNYRDFHGTILGAATQLIGIKLSAQMLFLGFDPLDHACHVNRYGL
jgi:hypothetical protein